MCLTVLEPRLWRAGQQNTCQYFHTKPNVLQSAFGRPNAINVRGFGEFLRQRRDLSGIAPSAIHCNYHSEMILQIDSQND